MQPHRILLSQGGNLVYVALSWICCLLFAHKCLRFIWMNYCIIWYNELLLLTFESKRIMKDDIRPPPKKIQHNLSNDLLFHLCKTYMIYGVVKWSLNGIRWLPQAETQGTALICWDSRRHSGAALICWNTWSDTLNSSFMPTFLAAVALNCMLLSIPEAHGVELYNKN